MKHLFLTLAVFLASTTHSLYSEAPHVNKAILLLKEEASFLNRELGLNIFSSGGSFLEKINSLELAVEFPRVTLDNARMFFSDILTDWIHGINSYEKGSIL